VNDYQADLECLKFVLKLESFINRDKDIEVLLNHRAAAIRPVFDAGRGSETLWNGLPL
jgi:hypothetical protein